MSFENLPSYFFFKFGVIFWLPLTLWWSMSNFIVIRTQELTLFVRQDRQMDQRTPTLTDMKSQLSMKNPALAHYKVLVKIMIYTKVSIIGFILKVFQGLFSRVHATLQVTMSVWRSVGRLVGLSHFSFFAFLSSLKVDKCRFKYLMSVRQQFGTLFLIFCFIWSDFL